MVGAEAASISETSIEVTRTQEKTSTMRRVLVYPHMQVWMHFCFILCIFFFFYIID